MAHGKTLAKVVSEGSHYRASFTFSADFKSTVDTTLYPTPRLAKLEAEQKASKLGVALVWEDEVQREEAEAAAEVTVQAEYGVVLVASGNRRKRGFYSPEEAEAWIQKRQKPENYVVSRIQ